MTPSNPGFDYDACDCHLCDLDRRHPDPIREEVRMSAPGCTCSKRFSYTEEHDSDCDLWYVDEFWAGFLAWSPDEECLVRTSTYPDGHDDPWSSAYADDIDMRLDHYEWINDNPLPDEPIGCGIRDDDAAVISQQFMNKVLGGYASIPDGVDGTWIKGQDGMWRPMDDTAEYQSALAKMGGTATSTTAHSDAYGWSDDWYWKNHHRHYETKITFPNGVTIQASSLVQNNCQRDNGEPDFGLYLDSGWRNEGIGIMLPWQDWGLPTVNYALAAEAISMAYHWAKQGLLVEVGCIGAHGRTGTALACMAIIAGVPANEAVRWVRSNYCNDAVEGLSQEWFVKWFAAYHAGEEPPAPLPKPKPQVTPKVHTPPPATSPSTGNPTGADPNKPGRKKRTRRGKRGGRRVQRSRSMAGVR